MNEYSNELKSRWLLHRKANDAAMSIQTDDKELDMVNKTLLIFVFIIIIIILKNPI